MSDLRYQTDEELLRRLKSNARYQVELRARIAEAERNLANLKSKLGGNEVQSRWIVKYLEDAE